MQNKLEIDRLPRSPRSDHEAALFLRRARVHVAAAVQVIVDLRGAAEHAGVEEDRERRRLQILLGRARRRGILPQHLQQQRRDHRIDVDAIDVARHAGVESACTSAR